MNDRKVIESYEDGAVELVEDTEFGLSLIVIDIDKLFDKANGRKRLDLIIPPGSVKTHSEFRKHITSSIDGSTFLLSSLSFFV